MQDSKPPAASRNPHAFTSKSHSEERGVEQGVPGTDVPRKSATRHQQAADEDRALAEQKRRESEADLDAT